MNKYIALFLLVLEWMVLSVLAANAQTGTEPQDIFVTAPFASAHASTIVELPNGDLRAAWFGGSAEGEPDVAIWSAVQHNGLWSVPAVLVREPNIACYNPVLFYSSDHQLWLYYKFGPSPREWSAGRLWSKDNGHTWSAPEHLPAGVYGPIRAKPLLLTDGTIISGTSVESYGSWAAWIERSNDNARSWFRIGPITTSVPTQARPGEPVGIIQPSIVDLGSGHLRLYARATKQIGHICSADSLDNGRHWTSARPISVPNPNSGIDVVRSSTGQFILVYNDSATKRTPLNLASSSDGLKFHPIRVLESAPGEYSYPALVLAHNGDLLITYTWNRKRIRFLRVPQPDLPH